MAEIVLSAEERRFFYFFPPSFGGVQPPVRIQESLAAKGLVAMGQDGRYWATVLGDKVRRGEVASVTAG